MPKPFKLDAAVRFLKQFPIVMDKEIQQAYRMQDDVSNTLRNQPVDHTYVKRQARTTSVLQPYQGRFISKGDVVLTEEATPIRKTSFHIEITQDQFDEMHDTYYNELGNYNTSNPDVYAFFNWLYTTFLIPQWLEDRRSVAYHGRYVAPAPGVAGAVLDAVDGIGVRIQRAITRGLVTPITLGAFSQATILAQWEQFCDSLPILLKMMPMNVYVSPQWWQMYGRAFQTANKTVFNPFPLGGTAYTDAMTMKSIVVCNWMSGSMRMICTHNRNLFQLSKRGGVNATDMLPFDVSYNDDMYTVRFKADPWMGFGVESYTTEPGIFDKQLLFTNELN